MNEKHESEVDKFFTELPEKDKTEANIFDDEKSEKKPSMKEQDEDPETAPDEIKNRRHRRLEDKLRKERESNIALNERVKALSEITEVSKNDEIDPRLLKIFGTTDLGKQISKEFSSVLSEYKKSARDEVISQLETERTKAQEEEQYFDDVVEDNLEQIEDKYGVDITSNRPGATQLRTRFLTLIEELSPKDENGDLSGYADFSTTFDLLKGQLTNEQPTASRQKQLASRQMPRQSSAPAQKQVTPGFFGWKKDLGLE